MQFSSAISTSRDTTTAVSTIIEQLKNELPSPDLILLFATAPLASTATLYQLKKAFPKAKLAGCSAQGVLGVGQEYEEGPAMVALGCCLPDVEIELLRIAPGTRSFNSRFPPEAEPVSLVLADPFTVDISPLLSALDTAWPGAVKSGGLASGGLASGENRIFVEQESFSAGAVVVQLWGDIRGIPVVAQGCRPLSQEPLCITRAEGNVLYELDNQPVIEVLESLISGLSGPDRAAFRQGAVIGLSPRASVKRGEWLVRNLLGLSRKEGSLRVGAPLEEGAYVSFQLRDPHYARAELQELLTRASREAFGATGSLQFSCLGRGASFFQAPSVDALALQQVFKSLPSAGLFCNGELGPVYSGGQTFLHGYTCSTLLMAPQGWC
jgi:small ligand-binding sensory domain FIST